MNEPEELYGDRLHTEESKILQSIRLISDSINIKSN